MKNKDEEVAKILYSIKIENLKIERKDNAIDDYFSFLRKMYNDFYEELLSTKKINRDKIYTLGTFVFGAKYKIEKMAKEYNEPFNEKNFVSFPGCHDFNSYLSSTHKQEQWKYLWYGYYKPFLDAIKVWIDSNGQEYPRLISQIGRNSKKEIVFDNLILLNGKELPKNIIDNMTKNSFPNYFYLQKVLASKETHKQVYSKIIKENFEPFFENFLVNEYSIWEELSNNYEHYMSLERVVELK